MLSLLHENCGQLSKRYTELSPLKHLHLYFINYTMKLWMRPGFFLKKPHLRDKYLKLFILLFTRLHCLLLSSKLKRSMNRKSLAEPKYELRSIIKSAYQKSFDDFFRKLFMNKSWFFQNNTQHVFWTHLVYGIQWR